MRQATWQRIEDSSFLLPIFRAYHRTVPDSVRAPLRALIAPDWTAATWLVRTKSQDKVVSGPFTGMKLELSALSQRHLLGYILGTQELELHSVIEQIISVQYPTVINVGAADGYYAVGLATRMPKSRVVAFEALDDMHPAIKGAADANGVTDRIALRGTCKLQDLRAELRSAASVATNQSESRALVLMDIEGGEIELLDPAAAPELEEADILVETHDMYVNDCTGTLIARFEGTHDVQRYTTRKRATTDFPTSFLEALPRFFPRLAVDLMDERRPTTQHWLYLTAKKQPNGGGLPAH